MRTRLLVLFVALLAAMPAMRAVAADPQPPAHTRPASSAQAADAW